MSVFKILGREHRLAIDALVVEHVRETLNFDLVSKDQAEWQKLHRNEVLLAKLLWELCREEADCTEKEFHRRLDHESLGNGLIALLGAVANFSPSLHRAVAAMQKAIRLETEVSDTAAEKASAMLDDPATKSDLMAAVDQAVDRARQSMKSPPPIPSTSVTSSPESSACPSAVTPGASLTVFPPDSDDPDDC